MKVSEKRTALQRALRRKRVRAKVSGTAKKPRLSVFRSNRNIELQLIDDNAGKTLARVSSKEIEGSESKQIKAGKAGKLLADKAKKAGIKEAVLDRRHYKYHGRVKAATEGVREGGVKI
jgi:large subunit ribosomal protein L18